MIDGFVAANTLNVAQALLGLPPNPDTGLAGAPGLTEISVGLPMADGAASPILVADEAGYFTEAGFDSVEIIDVEEPLLGVLTGELDFGVTGVADAADGASQGLPMAAIAGHRNYVDGVYGGDVLIVTADLLQNDPTTATAFLIAYVRGLRDLMDDPDFAPHDGGFGDRTIGGGTGELDDYLAGVGTATAAGPRRCHRSGIRPDLVGPAGRTPTPITEVAE